MIIHRYSEYEEPEEPPFTLDDLVMAATELMAKYHVEFNEALRYLLEQGLPINAFLQSDQLDPLLEKALEDIAAEQRTFHDRDDLAETVKREARRLDRMTDDLDQEMNDPAISDKLRAAAKNRNSSGFYQARFMSDGDPLTFDPLVRQTEFLDDLEKFNARFGKRFHGAKRLGKPDAHTTIQRYQALEELREQLVEAQERGAIFGIDEEKLRTLLGADTYENFAQAREELLKQLGERLQRQQLAEQEDDGVFKLTPAAARKVGERTLRALFESLRLDGTGGHRVDEAAEGAAALEKTRPYQFGDPLTHLDIASTLLNAMIREGATLPIPLKATDFVIHQTAGAAKSSLVVMLDMSGSMSRFGRFYNAKKMALALDALIRTHYPDDTIAFIGFATFARRLTPGEILSLGPEPITMMGGGVNLRIDFTKIKNPDTELAHVPRYFTNMQKGLEMARRILTTQQGKNKEIIMISDGAPTAWYEGNHLRLRYPPDEQGYSATIREARACADKDIRLNTFLLGNDFDSGYFGEGEFINNLMRANRGRLFHPEPDSLTRYVLVDYVASKRRLMEI